MKDVLELVIKSLVENQNEVSIKEKEDGTIEKVTGDEIILKTKKGELKKYNEFTQKELSVVGPIINLSYGNLPTLSKKHNFTLTITFDDGEVFTDMVEVNF